tara:strand:- start:445 stop:1407 length:963 start_codon:yes stop_codon:yes gene_type:complete
LSFKSKEKNPIIFVIAGPTASGKTQLAIDIAKKYKGTIINADSQQIYKDLSILSSQPNKVDFKNIPHKLFSFLEFYKSFSVKQWFVLTQKEIIKTIKEKKTPIIVGGTGMYLKALLDGLDIFPKVPVLIRQEGISLMNSLGVKKFYNNLKNKNSSCVYNISSNDKHRLIRSWEIYKITNQSIYELRKKNKKKIMNGYFFLKILIFPSKQKVYLNCINRWKHMINLGAVNEVKKIMLKEKSSNNRNFLKTIGFKELKNYLQEKDTLEVASQKSIKATKNYAKRQYTWFKHQFLANIVFKIEYKQNKRKQFLKEIADKLLTI